MQLSEPDFEAIKNGTAHTPDAPIECSTLIRMTKDDLSVAMDRKMPTILQKRDRRVLADCLELKERIEKRADAKEVFAAAMKLRRGNPAPFYRMEEHIQRRFLKELLAFRGAEGPSVEDIEKLMKSRTPLTAFSEHPDFRRFWGGGGADILSMNGTLSNRLEDHYEETIKYLSVITDATTYILSGERRFSEEYVRIDEPLLADLKEWMDVVFVYQKNSYSYELVGSGEIEVPKSVFTAVAALLPLHVPGQEKAVRIEEKNGGLEISGILAPNARIPQWHEMQVADLTHVSYIGPVDGSRFLTWLIHSLPDTLDFRMEDDRLIFRMRSWNQTEK